MRRHRFAVTQFAALYFRVVLQHGVFHAPTTERRAHIDHCAIPVQCGGSQHVLRGVADQVLGEVHDFVIRSEEHTSELQSLMRISYAVFCLKKKNKSPTTKTTTHT